jgi:MFS family permease
MGEFNAPASAGIITTAPPRSAWQSRKCIAICLLMALSFFQFNMDTIFSNSFQAMPAFLAVFGFPDPSLPGGYGIDSEFQSLMTALLQIGLAIGGLIQSPLSRWFPRRASFWVGYMFSIIAITVQITTSSQGIVYLGRTFLGIANGLYVSATILYISEVAPHNLRGSMVTMYIFLQSCGGIFGAGFIYAFRDYTTRSGYQIPLGILYIIPTFLFFFAYVPSSRLHRMIIPESPRWLTTRGKHEQALRALTRLRGNGCPLDDVMIEITEIRETTRIEQELGHDASFFDLFRGTDLRRTLLSIICSSAQAGSGINLVVGYSTYFYTVAGIANPFAITLIGQAIGIITTGLAIKMMNMYRRRPMFITGELLAAVFLIIIAGLTTGTQTTASGKAMVAFSILYTQVFEILSRIDIGLRRFHRPCLLDECVRNSVKSSSIVYNVVGYGNLLGSDCFGHISPPIFLESSGAQLVRKGGICFRWWLSAHCPLLLLLPSRNSQLHS